MGQVPRATVASAIALLTLPGIVASAPGPEQLRIQDCVARAAQHHRVNGPVLLAILRVESGLNPRAVGRNRDGSVDVGIGQINSRHFPSLARHGVRPEHLLDGCIGVYVAAWHLSTLIAAHGNSWGTVARYHSATPFLNHRYQLLLANELVTAGVIVGKKARVPPLGRSASRTAPSMPEADQAPAVVLDDTSPAPPTQ